MSTRRDFVMAGTAGALLPAAGAAVAHSVDAAPETASPARGFPAQATFERLRGEHFQIAGGGSLRLTEVQRLDLDPALRQFNLLLQAESPERMPGGLYELHHPQTGRFALRVERCDDGAGHVVYRADVSQLA